MLGYRVLQLYIDGQFITKGTVYSFSRQRYYINKWHYKYDLENKNFEIFYTRKSSAIKRLPRKDLGTSRKVITTI